jgi:hypothetical protein
MSRSIYLQILVFALIITLVGNIDNYGQNMKSKENPFFKQNGFLKDNQSNLQNRGSEEIQFKMEYNSKVVNGYIPTSIQTVLYDQTAGTTTNGIASQDFETVNDGFDCQAADNFTVPGGGWTIRRVIVGGFYGTTGPAAGFNVYFYADAGGVPGASPVYTALSQAYSYDGITYYSIGLSTPAVLAAGNYWISVQCRMDFGAGGQWFQFTSTGTFGATAQWQNPGNGFATPCTTWNPITLCNGSVETEMSFALTDEACPVIPLAVVEDFESSVFPPLCWTINTPNPPNQFLWLNSDGVGGYGNSNWSAVADFYDFFPAVDELITLEFDASAASNPALSFDWAYADFSGVELDELDIYYSTNGGTTWTILAAMVNGAPGVNNLNPFNLTSGPAYFPADDEWSTRTLALPTGTNKVKFTAISDFGNLLWVDNIAISDLFFDNFDSYTTGLRLCGQTTNWVTWSGPTGTTEDPFVSSTFSFSSSNSVRIVQNNDVVRVNGPKTSGVWYTSWMAYIPTGGSGYFNTLSDFAGAASEFAMQAFFNPGGTGTIDAAGAGSANFTYPHDDWFQVWMKVDLDMDEATLRINGALVHTWQYTLGTFGSPPIALQLDANDFFGLLASDNMYIDNYYFSAIPAPIQQLSADVGTASIDLDVAIAPGNPTPLASVQNFGADVQSFNVTMTIGAYSSTKSVTNLDPDEIVQVIFDPYTAVTGGPFAVEVCTELTGDQNTANDCQSSEVYVWDDGGTWSAGSNMPTARFLAAGTTYNENTADGTVGHLYSLSGVGPGAITTADCYDYNVATNTWTSIANMPAERDRFAAATVGNFIYAIGGYPENVTVGQGTVYRYDIAGNTWSTMAPLPTGEERGWHKAVGYNNNYVYIAGGISGDICATCTPGVDFFYESSVFVYNITTNTWTEATSMPGARFGGAFSIAGNQLVYIGGASDAGIEETVFVGTIDAGNPAVITWNSVASRFPGSQNSSYQQYSHDLIQSLNSNYKVKGLQRGGTGTPAGPLYRFDAAPWGSNEVIVTTGAPGGFVAANPNPAFAYNPTTDIWTAHENLPTPIVGTAFGTVNDGTIWKLIVAGGNPDGIAGLDITQIYTYDMGGASTFQLTVDVINSWNMVSVPGTNTDGMGVDTWWAFRDMGAQVFKFAGSYTPVTVTDPGEGYWMKHVGARTYNTGDEWPAGGIVIVPHDPVAAVAGWNLVGGYDVTVPVGSVTTTPPGLINATIFAYNGAYVAATDIEPGYAYWIKLSAAGSINLGGPLDKQSAQSVNNISEDWGRIIITDASGKSFTLYAVDGQVDLNYFEMPPMPPAGSFDVRYSSNRMAENLSSIQTIDMTAVEYPVTVSIENMSIRLMDETGKAVNENIEDGKQVVISDSRISKLKVSSELIPTVYALEQNYPNPFNPSTTIEFSLPEDVSSVKLTVYNALGERVAELVNGSLTAGRYSYQWDASDVATGMYIYELRTDNFVSIKKMVLLK